MTARPPIACVLMASGFSRRFGGNKLLAKYREKPLYAFAMDAIPADVFARVVVVARHPEVARAAAARGFLSLSKPEETEHASGTIRQGIGAVMSLSTPVAGCCFMVCDQPLLTQKSVRQLSAAFQREPLQIWALSHGQKKGNPVIFPAALFDELCGLLPAERGSAVIRRHSDLLRLHEAEHPFELLDVDTLEDLKALPRDGFSGVLPPNPR